MQTKTCGQAARPRSTRRSWLPYGAIDGTEPDSLETPDLPPEFWTQRNWTIQNWPSWPVKAIAQNRLIAADIVATTTCLGARLRSRRKPCESCSMSRARRPAVLRSTSCRLTEPISPTVSRSDYCRSSRRAPLCGRSAPSAASRPCFVRCPRPCRHCCAALLGRRTMAWNTKPHN